MKLLPKAVCVKYSVRFFGKSGATEVYLDMARAYKGPVMDLQRMFADMSKREELRRLTLYLHFAKRQQALMQGEQKYVLWPAWVFTPDRESLFSPASAGVLNTLLEATRHEVLQVRPSLPGMGRVSQCAHQRILTC